MLTVGNSMYDLICGVINYHASSFVVEKLSVYTIKS